MLDEVVGGLILAALTPGGADGEFLMRRKGKAFLRGKAATIPAYLQEEGRRPRFGRLRLRPDSDDLEWWRRPGLRRHSIQLGPALGRAPVTRTHANGVPPLVRGPAWTVRPTPGPEAILFLSKAGAKVFAPVLDGGEPPDNGES